MAAEMLAAVGLAPHNDPDAVRWVAIRHAPDHIHIVATLVRQDGDTVWAWNERHKAQAAARDLEQRYGLHRLGPPGRTTHRRPSLAEHHKAHRQARPQTPRDRLRHEVRAAAAAATDEDDFRTLLERAGVLVRLRHSTTHPDQITGYAVALPDHHTAGGNPIWYGGGRLAPDLTLPRLRRQWTNDASTYKSRYDQMRDAAATIHSGSQRSNQGHGDPEGLLDSAHAAADLLASIAHATERPNGGPLTDAADLLDRSIRSHRPGTQHNHLRALSRLLHLASRHTDRETAAALQLLLQIAKLADSLADLHDARRRLHQARAARSAAARLRDYVEANRTTQPRWPGEHRHPSPTGMPADARPGSGRQPPSR
ncbi:relaxase/mobilization nuclease domain-containing protein [Solwaraspora sp. WMMD1047]|uniref:relaxase/mobilization nuclease domain-containing protein n=1 Tax=Solwaraspora sp. WMMD1047 TaxID=3016102 RepID=UPI002417B5D3|nr:relaxase/mobilization nuclease domain-containing protein [Solwaraspora sp. WMMD1047]MDG4833054.1 relaxase/mobilization nuclease domain-containing protein [Solwaraspora sp. WMMD1047]